MYSISKIDSGLGVFTICQNKPGSIFLPAATPVAVGSFAAKSTPSKFQAIAFARTHLGSLPPLSDSEVTGI